MSLYNWDEEIVIDALTDFVEQYCGHHDEDFMTECIIQAYCDRSWEACIVMDYIDRKLGATLEKYTLKSYGI